MAKLLISLDELGPAMQATMVKIGDETFVDVHALADALDRLTGQTRPPALRQLHADAVMVGGSLPPALEAVGQALDDGAHAFTCDYCGSHQVELAIANTPDSRCCTTCDRHVRTGHSKETYLGRMHGQTGPAPASVPAAPLGVGVEGDPRVRMATPDHGHMAPAVSDGSLSDASLADATAAVAARLDGATFDPEGVD